MSALPRDAVRADAALSAMQSVSFAHCFDPPPPLRFVLPGLLEGGVGLIVGQGAIGKTYMALEILRGFAMGDGIASGDAGALYRPQEVGEGTAGAILGEDPPAIIQTRLHAMLSGRGMDRADAQFLGDVLDIKSGVGGDMTMAVPGAGGQLVPGPFYSMLARFCEGKKLVVLDPLIRLANGIDEQDNARMGVVMQFITRIAYETNCAILVLHHVGKGSGDGREEAARARGASSITTSVRLQLDMRPPSATEMPEFGIPEDQRNFYVRVAQVKANYAASREPVWLRRGDGGVLRHVALSKVPQREERPRQGQDKRGTAAPYGWSA